MIQNYPQLEKSKRELSTQSSDNIYGKTPDGAIYLYGFNKGFDASASYLLPLIEKALETLDTAYNDCLSMGEPNNTWHMAKYTAEEIRRALGVKG